jgi:N-acetylglutamate synthase-like GNAT family acetyltransferase
MTLANLRVRRATVEDLPTLKMLWASMQFPVEELEKRLTEFQVVESAPGQLAGAIGIQILRGHAWLHSEAYHDFTGADDMRALVLDRIRSLTSNHGVFRLWTRENAPFWTRNGFQPADAEALKKLPETWSASGGTSWLSQQLKDEAAIVSVEKELALFMESEKRQTARAMQQAKTIKTVATWVAALLAVLIIGVVAYVFLKRPGIVLPPR